jgi:hypothetical protein
MVYAAKMKTWAQEVIEECATFRPATTTTMSTPSPWPAALRSGLIGTDNGDDDEDQDHRARIEYY